MAHTNRSYPNFCSVKQRGVFIFPPGWNAVVKVQRPHGLFTHLQIKSSRPWWLGTWLGTLCFILGQDCFLSECLSQPRCITEVPTNLLLGVTQSITGLLLSVPSTPHPPTPHINFVTIHPHGDRFCESKLPCSRTQHNDLPMTLGKT